MWALKGRLVTDGGETEVNERRMKLKERENALAKNKRRKLKQEQRKNKANYLKCTKWKETKCSAW